MAADDLTAPDTGASGAPLRVRLDGPVEHRVAATWALEALLVRARVREWIVVDEAMGDADLVWGGTGTPTAVDLPADGAAWAFGADAPPDAGRDPLAAAFWWLARVEELPELAPADAFDEHGRFRAAAAAIVRGGDPLATPVDDLAEQLAGRLAAWREARGADEPRFRVVASHDIDLPWRWTRVGRRRALRSVRDLVRAGRAGAAARVAGAIAARPVGRLRGRDPWDNFARIERLERELGAESTSYLLVGRHAPQDGDDELHARGARWHESVPGAAGRGLLGLHGSYTASDVAGRLAAERELVEARVGAPVRDHRFHYLRHLPTRDWSELARVGIASDASLGFAEVPGFRAGTAHPFRAWDHAAGAPTQVVVIPLAVMDASYDARYLDLGRRQRAAHVRGVLDRIRERGGSASLLVHNDRLCNVDDDGWTAEYRGHLRWIRDAGGVACTAADAAAAYRAWLPAHRTARG